MITGAARGIGRAIAAAFADMGDIVVLVDRDERVHDAAVAIGSEGQSATAIQADVAVKANVERLFATAAELEGRIDVLANNAARAHYGLAVELSEQEWNESLADSLTSAFLCSQVAAAHMLRAGRGKIVNVSSASSSVVHRRTCAHAASKAGLEALTRVMAIELAPHVQVNAIVAGPVETERSHELLTPDELRSRRDGVPAGRLGTLADVAQAATYLASEQADWITGTAFTVDGGYSLAVKS